MRSCGRVLVIDDEPEWVGTYRDLFAADGYEVVADGSAEAVRRRLATDVDWDVVILDMKLRGPSGGNEGLELVADLRASAPLAKVIMVTGYAERKPIVDAFAAGVYDLLEKPGRQHPVLLQTKVRNAWEMVRAQRLAVLSHGEQEAAIEATYQAALTETDRNKKGLHLEQLMVLLFRSIPGFGAVDTRRRNDVEELDLFIENRSTELPWLHEGRVFLGECKNWSKPVGAPEFVAFREKLRRRYGRCKLGFFIALGGFAETVAEMQERYSLEDFLIVLIGREELGALSQSTDRGETLKQLYYRTLHAMNGKAGSRKRAP